MKTTKIVVDVSPEQARLFAVLGKKIEATPGQVLLSLACDHLKGNPPSAERFPDVELAALCWEHAHRHQLPDAGQWLDSEQMKELGYETGGAGVSHA